MSLPTLPLPPAFYTPGWLLGPAEASPRAVAATLATRLAGVEGIRVVHPGWIDLSSPPGARLDVCAELTSGFPYGTRLAEMHVRSLFPPAPLKGLITDLDDTLWRGILGDDRPEGVSWDLDHKSHGHGLYQLFLATLAESGVLVGVATRNDPALVREAFARKDLVFPASLAFPVEAGWGPKSASVGRILQAWNLGPESVLFVDDSALERAEVAQAHPALQVRPFPAGDDAAIWDLILELRDLFGRPRLSEEDSLRPRA